jgi:hypothetical protein
MQRDTSHALVFLTVGDHCDVFSDVGGGNSRVVAVATAGAVDGNGCGHDSEECDGVNGVVVSVVVGDEECDGLVGFGTGTAQGIGLGEW